MIIISKNKPKICICVSTWNRPEILTKSILRHDNFRPDNSSMLVVQDGESEFPAHSFSTYIFNTRSGIPTVKNKCLELAMESDADHFFLFDDDCHPIAPDWHLPYVESPFPHLCFTYLPASHNDGIHKFHSLPNGCGMYIHRSVVEKIGGFDTAFGLGKYEHVHFSNRCYAAGLTPKPFIDIIGSNKLLYAMDSRKEVARSFSSEEDLSLMQSGRSHFYKTRFSTDFIPYKK